MSYSSYPISYCFGAYNEEEIIIKTLKELTSNLSKVIGTDKFEILVVENGSTDKTVEKLKKIKDKHIRIIYSSQKGHGLALKMAINSAKYEHVVLTGADLPFGFSDLNEAIKIWEKYDLIFGSKIHKKSAYPTAIKRKVASKIYSFLLQLFFKLNIKDPQGSIFLKKSSVMPILQYCNEENAFFTSQLAIYGNLLKLKMKEIPVIKPIKKEKERKSKYNILKDGSKMFVSILKEYVKYREISYLY